jgi:hypothetical protein
VKYEVIAKILRTEPNGEEETYEPAAAGEEPTVIELTAKEAAAMPHAVRPLDAGKKKGTKTKTPAAGDKPTEGDDDDETIVE